MNLEVLYDCFPRYPGPEHEAQVLKSAYTAWIESTWGSDGTADPDETEALDCLVWILERWFDNVAMYAEMPHAQHYRTLLEEVRPVFENEKQLLARRGVVRSACPGRVDVRDQVSDSRSLDRI